MLYKLRVTKAWKSPSQTDNTTYKTNSRIHWQKMEKQKIFKELVQIVCW